MDSGFTATVLSPYFCDNERLRESIRIEPTEPMAAYILRRLLLVIPTLFGIMLISFAVVQFAPGGPVERIIAQMSGSATGADSRIPGGGQSSDFGAQGQLQGGNDAGGMSSKYRGARGLDPVADRKF